MRSLAIRILAAWIFTVPGASLSVAETGEGAVRPEYDFAGARPEALAHYRQGWIEILEYGRWAEAERLYRKTLAVDPEFTVAKSVLARITLDSSERDALYAEVQASLDDAEAAERLLLTTYQQTLELFAMRERGEDLPAGYREAMAERAVRDYGAFIRQYPGEWSVMIEYIEWIHALEGPEAAIQAINRLREESSADLSFSYFESYFYAEIGDLATAADLAEEFEMRIGDDTSPQPHYLRAYIAFKAGDLESAGASIDRALELDPRHLIAERLKKEIEAAR